MYFSSIAPLVSLKYLSHSSSLLKPNVKAENSLVLSIDSSSRKHEIIFISNFVVDNTSVASYITNSSFRHPGLINICVVSCNSASPLAAFIIVKLLNTFVPSGLTPYTLTVLFSNEKGTLLSNKLNNKYLAVSFCLTFIGSYRSLLISKLIFLRNFIILLLCHYRIINS